MWSKITDISTIASLLGVSISSVFTNAWQSHLMVAASLICVSYLTWRGHVALTTVIKRKYPKGYKPIATFMRYSTSDGKIGVYEHFRHIQLKNTLTKSIPHRYYWTGNNQPKVNSALQTVVESIPWQIGKESEVLLKLKEPRYYNSSEILNTSMQVDDSDEKAEPYICLKVTEPMQLIHLRAELLHAKPQHFSKKAFVERKSVDANQAAAFEQITVVSIDPMTRAYEHMIKDPEPGYNYRLRWDRIVPTKAQKRKP